MQLSAHSLIITQFPGILSLSLQPGTGNMKGGKLQQTVSILFAWRSLMLMFFSSLIRTYKILRHVCYCSLNNREIKRYSQMCNTFYTPWYLFLCFISPPKRGDSSDFCKSFAAPGSPLQDLTLSFAIPCTPLCCAAASHGLCYHGKTLFAYVFILLRS